MRLPVHFKMNLVAKELLPYLDTHSLRSCDTPNYKSVIGE